MIRKSFGNTSATTWETIYEVPGSKRADWVMVYATNKSGAATPFSMRMYKAVADTTVDIFINKTLPGEAFFQMGGGFAEFISLQHGDRIESITPGVINIMCSVEEHNDIIQGG